MSLASSYHCTNCGAERWDEIREKTSDDVQHLKIIYECGSYKEMKRVGHVWKHIGDVYKCGPPVAKKKLAS